MSDEYAWGGVWPDDDLDALDIAHAIRDARNAVRGAATESAWDRSDRDLERDADISYVEMFDDREVNFRWSFDGWFPGGDRYFSGTSSQTAHASRDSTFNRATHDGNEPAWSWEHDHFPFHQGVYFRGVRGDNERGAVHEGFFWLARHVYIPRGWASFLFFDLEEPRDIWGTVPGHGSPLRLPDDFLTSESSAWRLFDRPVAAVAPTARPGPVRGGLAPRGANR